MPRWSGLEVLLDRNARSVLAYVLLLGWTAVVVLDMVWQQVKVDATLGHMIMGEAPPRSHTHAHPHRYETAVSASLLHTN
jgi:hypothetical protein